MISIVIFFFVCWLVIAILGKGWWGERKTGIALWLSLNKKDYSCTPNIILSSHNGTAQIDHIVISKYGIFIVETKNMSGWIFGDASNERWTQTIYRNKYSFQNPLRQTYRQKKVLAQFLRVNEINVFPIIFFNGRSQFRTKLPINVIDRNLGRYIKSFKKVVLSQEEVERIKDKINHYKTSSNLTTYDHLQSLDKRHNSNTRCPKCGGTLVEKTARRGRFVGKNFLGCNNYPKCRYTKNI